MLFFGFLRDTNLNIIHGLEALRDYSRTVGINRSFSQYICPLKKGLVGACVLSSGQKKKV